MIEQTDEVDVGLKGCLALGLVDYITWLACSTRILVTFYKVFEEVW
jgi:hypothetical protein